MEERTPNGTYYYVFDGMGNVAMLVDPPSGAPVAITSPCPTGNQSGDQWQAPNSHALDDELLQAGGAWGVLTELGTGNLKDAVGYAGARGTGPTHIYNAAELVAGGGSGPYVYRGLTLGDIFSLALGEGLIASAPNATYPVTVQVNGKTPTQYISTSKSLDVAGRRFGQHGVVRIDLSRVYPYTPVIDISNGINGTKGYLNSLARRNQEVLIVGQVPQDAVDQFYPAGYFQPPDVEA